MNIDISTINVLLGLVIALQAWIIRELMRIKETVAVISSNCPYCRARLQLAETEDL